jgi:hypothetical protein
MKFSAFLLAFSASLVGCVATAPRAPDGSIHVEINQLGPNTYQAGTFGMDSDSSCRHVVRAKAAPKCLASGKTLKEEHFSSSYVLSDKTYACTLRFRCE